MSWVQQQGMTPSQRASKDEERQLLRVRQTLRQVFDEGGDGFQHLVAECRANPSWVTRRWAGSTLLDRLIFIQQGKNLSYVESFYQAFPNALVSNAAGALSLVRKVPRLSTLRLSVSFTEKINPLDNHMGTWHELIRALANSDSMTEVELSFLLSCAQDKLPICLAIRSVANLKVLRLQGPAQWVKPDDSRDINEAMVFLLQQNEIEELSVDGFYLMDHIPFYAELGNNTSLKVLDIPFFINTPAKREALSRALQTNKSLESLPCWKFPYSEAAPIYRKIWYWLLLNRLGRQKIYALETTKEVFVHLLEQATQYDGDRLGHPDDSLFQAQMTFGLLSERPSLWSVGSGSNKRKEEPGSPSTITKKSLRRSRCFVWCRLQKE